MIGFYIKSHEENQRALALEARDKVAKHQTKTLKEITKRYSALNHSKHGSFDLGCSSKSTIKKPKINGKLTQTHTVMGSFNNNNLN